MDVGTLWAANEESEIPSWNVGAANENRFVVSALTPVPTELRGVVGTWEGREAQVPLPFAPHQT